MSTTTATGHRKSWTYTDDLGHAWRFGVKAIYVFRAAAGIVGGSAAAATVPRLPKGLRPRAVLCTADGYPNMWVPCYTKTAYLWVNVNWAVIRCVRGQDVVYWSTSHRREEYRPRDASRQST